MLSITHEIIKSVDTDLKKKKRILDISKGLASDIIFKRQNDISGDLLNIFSDFLSIRKQRVVLSG